MEDETRKRYSRAYTEVLEILKYMPEEDVKKIPKSMIDTFEYYSDKSYEYHISPKQDFGQLSTTDETDAIMVNIFKNYWATPEQRETIQRKMDYDMKTMKIQQYESLLEEEDNT